MDPKDKSQHAKLAHMYKTKFRRPLLPGQFSISKQRFRSELKEAVLIKQTGEALRNKITESIENVKKIKTGKSLNEAFRT